jgi:hypothetical protein
VETIKVDLVLEAHRPAVVTCWRADGQRETVKRYSALSNTRWTIDVGELDVAEHAMCAEDTAHGLGTCYIKVTPRERDVNTPDLDGVCPDCGIGYLTKELRDGDYACVEVTW